MKNIKRLLVATVALLSVGSMANLMQPHVAVSEDAPMRVSAGIISGMLRGASPQSETKAFGLNNIGLGLGFTHNVGYDFEYGLALGGSWATPESGRIFAKDFEKAQGVRLEVELLARFMPEIADAFRLGGFVSVGYSSQFGGEALKAWKEKIAFGDLGLRVGLATSFGFSDMVSMYFAPGYALTSIRFYNDKATDADKKDQANFSGLELPIGFWFSVADNVGMYLEANTRFMNLKKFGDSWKEDVTLGVSFAI